MLPAASAPARARRRSTRSARRRSLDSFARSAGVLDDLNPRERALGIGGGFAWGAHASMTVVYCDRGISRGMLLGILDALRARRPIVVRSLATNAGAIAHAAEILERLRLAGARAIARGRARGRRAA